MKGFLILILLSNSKIMPSLREILKNASPFEKIAVLVHLKEKPDYERIKNLPPKEYVEFLKNFSENSQREILNYLKQNFSDKIGEIKSYWIFNGFYLKAEKEVIENLAKRKEVEYIIEDFIIQIEAVTPAEEDGNIDLIEWNILRVRADSCWMTGYDGTGVIVGDMSTGVDINHPALQGKWLEPYWYDGINGQPFPYDDHGNGTHDLGIILGGDGLGPFPKDIGVAPGAKFVACKICNANGSCFSSAIHAGFQKIAEWKSQGINIVALNNPWLGGGLEYWDDCLNLRNLGIIPIFRVSSNGPDPGTVDSPADYPLVIGVTAVDSLERVPSFCGRGPAPDTFPWNDSIYWYRSDWNLTKPDISALGISITSSIPPDTYATWSSAGRAAPHITGAIAILCQRNPYLNVYEIYQLLTDYAYHPPQGEPYPNNDYGWGILNIYQSLLNTPLPNMPYLYIHSHTLQDAGGDSIWDPGEFAYITLTLKNTGINADSVQAVLRTTSPYVTIQDSVSFFGNIPQGDTVNNSSDPYVVVASSSAPSGTQVDFEVYITASGGYSTTDGFSVYIGVPGVDWADHDCGNILLTVTRYGAIGYMSSNQVEGNGCQYPVGSSSHLFYGGFAIGTVFPYVIDRYYESNQSDDDDWVTVTEPDGHVYMYEPYPPYDEYSVAIYDDSGGEEVKGITCTQKGYAWSNPNADDFVILEFVLKNNGSQDITGLYAGIFLDWDINPYDQNLGGTDAGRSLAYMYYSSTCVGSAILNPKRGSVQIANISMIYGPTYTWPYAGLPDSIEIKFLNGTYSFPSADTTSDWSTCISAGPFDIPVGDSVIVAFAIAGGNSLSSLEEHIDTAYNRYWSVYIQEKFPSKKKFIKIFPTLSKGEIYLNYAFPFNTKMEISVFNLAGIKVKRFLYSLERNKEIKKISLKGFPQGIYIIKVKTPYILLKEKIILVK